MSISLVSLASLAERLEQAMKFVMIGAEPFSIEVILHRKIDFAIFGRTKVPAITVRATLHQCAFCAVVIVFIRGSTLFHTNPQDACICGKENHKGSSVCWYFMSKIEKGYYDPEHN